MARSGAPGRFWPWAALLVIVAAAAVADAWKITSDGLETFYAAAVRSMAGNWHDFLYASFDPSGTITLDKLPGPFWVQALSVRAFGFSVWAMVLPQVVWSVLTVIVLFLSVRRAAGPAAGLVAAALLAISPVTIIAAQGNLGDPLFVLLSVLAADAVLRAADGGRRRWLVLAALWAGLAFQTKMAEAWLLAGVLALVYLACGPRGLRARASQLAIAVPVTAVISLAWMTVVALTPARSRPYADGSEHNSVFEQVFGYNGFGRFGGNEQIYGLRYLAKPTEASVTYFQRSEAAFASMGDLTHPSWDRLLTAPVAQLTGWLLVPALVIAVAAVVAVCRARGGAQRQESAPFLAWGLWLLAFTAVFSAGQVVQPYYFVVLSPAIAALCALGFARCRSRLRPGGPSARRWWLVLAAGMTGAGLCSAGILAEVSGSWHWAGAAAGGAALVAGGAAAALIASGRAAPRAGTVAVRGLLALTAAAGLAGPVIADGWAYARHAGPFDTLFAPGGTYADMAPSAAAGLREYPGYTGAVFPRVTAAFWKQLRTYGQVQNKIVKPGHWIAVYSSSAAAEFVLAGVRGTLPIGGFTGVAPSPTATQLTGMLDKGVITYAVIPGPADTRRDDPRVQAIIRHCRQSAPARTSASAAVSPRPTAQPQIWLCEHR